MANAVNNVAILLVDFSEKYKKGTRLMLIGKDVLIDGKAYKSEDLVENGTIVIGTQNSFTPVYDEDAVEKLVRHSTEDAFAGRYEYGKKVFVYDTEGKRFVTAILDEVTFPEAIIRTGMVLPSDTTQTKGLRRLANLNKAYCLGLSDAEIAEAVLGFDDWYVKPEKAEQKTNDEKLTAALEAIASHLAPDTGRKESTTEEEQSNSVDLDEATKSKRGRKPKDKKY